MESAEETKSEILDKEWVDLMVSAREIGLAPEEIRDFLYKSNS